jgi:site-specific recombinase XerD
VSTLIAATASSSDALAVLDVTEYARAYLDAAVAPATRRAYESDWRLFSAWCVDRGLTPMPATSDTVVRYVIGEIERGRTVATLLRRLSSVATAHRAAGYESPTRAAIVRRCLQGVRRRAGTAPQQVAALSTADVVVMLAATGPGVRGRRDRAILLLGFAGAFRRSELVALDVADVVACPEGLRVTIRSSKTDQQGAGRVVGIPHGRGATDPVHAVQEWIAAAALTDGPLFRSFAMCTGEMGGRLCARNVARLVQSTAARAGLAGRFGGHSLRAGHATTAAANGASERAIMEQTGHRSTTMVRRYIRAGALFADNTGGRLGL